MAFKSIEKYAEEKYNGRFRLENNGDAADVIILYPDKEHALVCDAHYLKSGEYTGYVQCIGTGCPCCKQGKKLQTKLFIPLLNLATGQVEFFDRSVKFLPQLDRDVFNRYSNPSEYIFRITRRGEAGDVDTRYEIRAISANSLKAYDEIMTEYGLEFPNFYDSICKDASEHELVSILGSQSQDGQASEYKFTPTPRVDVSQTLDSYAAPTAQEYDFPPLGEDDVDF